MDEAVRRLLAGAPEPDPAARDAVRARAAATLRPPGAFARLDALAVWMAGWQRTDRPVIERPVALLFAGDHGVTAEGVSAYAPEITAAVVESVEKKEATAPVLARLAGAEVVVIDAGVGEPTANLARRDAMTEERFGACFELGRRAVVDVQADLLVLGEMGIGNTTAAAAVAAGLYGGAPPSWTGRGAGIDDAGFERKVEVVSAAAARVAGSSPLEVLRRVGGAELVTLAGAALEARIRSIPVVLDGFVVAAAVAPLHRLHRPALAHSVAGHRSPEPGHGRLLDALGLEPVLDLGLRLGEGSGALLAVPILRAACAAVTEVTTFEERGLSR